MFELSSSMIPYDISCWNMSTNKLIRHSHDSRESFQIEAVINVNIDFVMKSILLINVPSQTYISISTKF